MTYGDKVVTKDSIIPEILRRADKGPVVVGINGLDCSGKTTFARNVFETLQQEKAGCTLLHIDDFNHRDVQGKIYDAHETGNFSSEWLDLYYRKSIKYDAVIEAIRDCRHEQDITLIEGVFLFKEKIASLIDIKIFLSIDPLVARLRYENRKQSLDDPRPLSVFEDIWVPAFERYCIEEVPKEKADFMIFPDRENNRILS